jgi:prophage antirepressor-like protein
MNTGGGLPRKTISESGFYKLIGRSDKPVARAFQDWVTREVLPAIEKDGGYIMGEEKVATGEMDDEDVAMSRAITPRLLPVDSL